MIETSALSVTAHCCSSSSAQRRSTCRAFRNAPRPPDEGDVECHGHHQERQQGVCVPFLQRRSMASAPLSAATSHISALRRQGRPGDGYLAEHWRGGGCPHDQHQVVRHRAGRMRVCWCMPVRPQRSSANHNMYVRACMRQNVTRQYPHVDRRCSVSLLTRACVG